MPTYGLVEFWKPRDNWYDLTPEEKNRFLDGIRENIATLSAKGVKRLGIYRCRGFGDWDGMAFFECPDAESVEAVAEGSESHDWYHYFEGNNIAGTFQSLEEWASHVARMGDADPRKK